MFQRPDQPEQVVARIQNGDGELRERLLADSLPEIRHWVRRITRSVFSSLDDETSIAFFAFNQAVDRYRPEMNAPFFSYAYLVVKHRLFDYIRQQRSAPAAVSLEEEGPDGQWSLEDQLADPQSSRAAQDLEIQESLLQLEVSLEQFGYRLPALTRRFPKHRDSQRLCLRISRQLAGDEALYSQLLTQKRLPGSALSARCQVPVKTIEKNRGSIILLCLLLKSDLQVIQSYIALFEEEAID